MKFEKIVYPDGQVSAKVVDATSNPEMHDIRMRLNSYEDLFYAASIKEALDYMGIPRVSIMIPCLFGQRSDRRPFTNQSLDMRVIANFINSCNFSEVVIYHPHCEQALIAINRSVPIYPLANVNSIIKSLTEDNLVLVAPDAGAYKHVWAYGETSNTAVVGAVKHRDTSGKIDLAILGDVKNKTCLIIDDLADGGYTFVVLAERLKQLGAKKVYLYVSHGYFNKGFDELKKNIDHIWCTNSVKDIDDPYVTQFKII